MQQTERAEFDKQIAVMAGGFPKFYLTEDKRDSYWRGLEKMPMSSLVRIVDHVLSEEGPENIPSVSQMWTFHRQLRAKRPDNRTPFAQSGKLTREQHLAHLRHMAIICARRETMPHINGIIIGWEYVPPRHREKSKAEWMAWEKEYGDKPDDFWWPRAQELMRLWGEKRPELANVGDLLGRIA